MSVKLLTINVEGTGHGIGFASYPVEFSFTMIAPETGSTEEDHERIVDRVRRELKRKTACDHVTIKQYEVR